MIDVKLSLDENGQGEFYITLDEEKVGFMQVEITKDSITAFHTEVVQKPETKGFGKHLLDTMVDYARKNGLKVIPLCPYVHLQFKRHPEEYNDVWLKKAAKSNS